MASDATPSAEWMGLIESVPRAGRAWRDILQQEADRAGIAGLRAVAVQIMLAVPDSGATLADLQAIDVEAPGGLRYLLDQLARNGLVSRSRENGVERVAPTEQGRIFRDRVRAGLAERERRLGMEAGRLRELGERAQEIDRMLRAVKP